MAHIPVALGLSAPAEAYDCERYSLLDSCIKVFKETLPRTLLKEHYRCHPRIIQFCNQQFYDNALVPMTERPNRIGVDCHSVAGLMQGIRTHVLQLFSRAVEIRLFQTA